MKYIIYLVILIIAIVGFTLQQNPKADFSVIENFSINSTSNISITSQPELASIINSFVNALLEIASAIVRWSVSIAKAYPYVSWKLIILLITLSVLSPLIFVIIKVCALFIIFIKEIIQSRKEKKILEKYKKKELKRGLGIG